MKLNEYKINSFAEEYNYKFQGKYYQIYRSTWYGGSWAVLEAEAVEINLNGDENPHSWLVLGTAYTLKECKEILLNHFNFLNK